MKAGRGRFCTFALQTWPGEGRMRALKLLPVLLTALSLCFAGAARSEPVKLRVGWIVPVTNLAPILFAKQGVARHNGQSYIVDAIRFQGSTLQISALANGEL